MQDNRLYNHFLSTHTVRRIETDVRAFLQCSTFLMNELLNPTLGLLVNEPNLPTLYKFIGKYKHKHIGLGL